MIKVPNALLACALGAGSLLGVAAPASAAHLSSVTTRSVTRGPVVHQRSYTTVYRTYGYRSPYRYGYAYPYSYGYPYGYGVGLSVGYGGVNVGYGVGPGYGYAPYPAAYAAPAYVAPRPWHPRRVYRWRRY